MFKSIAVVVGSYLLSVALVLGTDHRVAKRPIAAVVTAHAAVAHAAAEPARARASNGGLDNPAGRDPSAVVHARDPRVVHAQPGLRRLPAGRPDERLPELRGECHSRSAVLSS